MARKEVRTMGDKYSHETSHSDEWPVEQQVNDILGVPSHSHTITDNDSGKSVTGTGRTADEASESAWNKVK